MEKQILKIKGIGINEKKRISRGLAQISFDRSNKSILNKAVALTGELFPKDPSRAICSTEAGQGYVMAWKERPGFWRCSCEPFPELEEIIPVT